MHIPNSIFPYYIIYIKIILNNMFFYILINLLHKSKCIFQTLFFLTILSILRLCILNNVFNNIFTINFPHKSKFIFQTLFFLPVKWFSKHSFPFNIRSICSNKSKVTKKSHKQWVLIFTGQVSACWMLKC